MMWDSQDYYFFFLPQRLYFFLDFFENQKQKVKKKKNAIFTGRFIIPLLIFRFLPIQLISELTE